MRNLILRNSYVVASLLEREEGKDLFSFDGGPAYGQATVFKVCGTEEIILVDIFRAGISPTRNILYPIHTDYIAGVFEEEKKKKKEEKK